MIKPKYGICIDCNDGLQKPLIAKRCQSHYWQHRNKIKSSKPADDSIVEKSIKTKTGASELVLWYQKIMREEAPVCWECNKKINKNNPIEWHGSIAHILPKSIFPSIKTHPYNYLILGMYCCHGQYDSNWQNASKMQVLHIAKIRFDEFKESISKSEYRRIPEIFLS